jgi:FtsH-binding integral membrane protein
MWTLFWIYLFIGTIVGLIIESTIRWTGEDVNGIERFWLITVWPLMVLIFIFYFLRSLFGIDD